MRFHDHPDDTKAPKKFSSRVGTTIMKSYRFHVPRYDLPFRLRPWFLAFTCAVMVLLAFLGFTDFSRALSLNDKLLHFFCFMIATGVFYFIVDIEESARRVWFWRYFNLIFTLITCLLCGGILSEVVQSLLPYKEFQIGDVAANLLGASLGLVFSYHIEKYYRYRREISRLYRPLDNDSLSDFEDDLENLGTQLLPTHSHHTTHPYSRQAPEDSLQVGFGGGASKSVNLKGSGVGKKKGNVRFASDLFVARSDSERELFNIGEDETSDSDYENDNDAEEARSSVRETNGHETEQNAAA